MCVPCSNPNQAYLGEGSLSVPLERTTGCVARQVLKLPKDKGGLGIPDLGIVATALHVRWTQVALSSDMLLTRSFTSFFLSTRLRLFSQSTFSHCVPRSGSPSPFYAEAANSLARLREVHSDIDVISTPLQDLVDYLTPVFPHIAKGTTCLSTDQAGS